MTIQRATSAMLLLWAGGMSMLSEAFAPNQRSLSFSSSRDTLTTTIAATLSSPSALFMAKAAKKKQKKKTSGGGGAGLKGFGGGVPSSKEGGGGGAVELDRSQPAREFYSFLEQAQAGDNLKRCALGYFSPLEDDEDFKLRGVVAMKPLKKEDIIIRIPYEAAINLGQEGADPTLPAVQLLRDYCMVLGTTTSTTDSAAPSATRRAYYEMLPGFLSDDCLGSTDFFSDEALQALQSPMIFEETVKRRELCQTRFDREIKDDDDFPKWIDGTTSVTVRHLQWAVWLITSRVLTVQGDPNEGKSYRLLIPFLDMCNHDRDSPHILTGRAMPGGELKVVAGSTVKAGEQINICYGGGMAGNDRFIQDYGFLDDGMKAYDMVAQQLTGKRRVVEGIGAGRTISPSDREETLNALKSTTMEEDKHLLENATDPSLKVAYKYRLRVKQALSKYMDEMP